MSYVIGSLWPRVCVFQATNTPNTGSPQQLLQQGVLMNTPNTGSPQQLLQQGVLMNTPNTGYPQQLLQQGVLMNTPNTGSPQQNLHTGRTTTIRRHAHNFFLTGSTTKGRMAFTPPPHFVCVCLPSIVQGYP